MRPHRLFTILANACAILLLGLIGIAVAGPALILSGLDLYGPVPFSGPYSVEILSSGLWIGRFLSEFVPLYVVSPALNLDSLFQSNASQLFADSISQVVILPATDSIFAAVPEPIGLSVVVAGVAALSFVRRRLRSRRQN